MINVGQKLHSIKGDIRSSYIRPPIVSKQQQQQQEQNWWRSNNNNNNVRFHWVVAVWPTAMPLNTILCQRWNTFCAQAYIGILYVYRSSIFRPLKFCQVVMWRNQRILTSVVLTQTKHRQNDEDAQSPRLLLSFLGVFFTKWVSDMCWFVHARE